MMKYFGFVYRAVGGGRQPAGRVCYVKELIKCLYDSGSRSHSMLIWHSSSDHKSNFVTNYGHIVSVVGAIA